MPLDLVLAILRFVSGALGVEALLLLLFFTIVFARLESAEASAELIPLLDLPLELFLRPLLLLAVVVPLIALDRDL